MALATRGGELRSISWESSVTEDGVSPCWLTSVALVQRTTSLSKIQVNCRKKPSEYFLNPSESISLTHLKHSCWYPVKTKLLMKWYESCTVQFLSQYTVCVPWECDRIRATNVHASKKYHEADEWWSWSLWMICTTCYPACLLPGVLSSMTVKR